MCNAIFWTMSWSGVNVNCSWDISCNRTNYEVFRLHLKSFFSKSIGLFFSRVCDRCSHLPLSSFLCGLFPSIHHSLKMNHWTVPSSHNTEKSFALHWKEYIFGIDPFWRFVSRSCIKEIFDWVLVLKIACSSTISLCNVRGSRGISSHVSLGRCILYLESLSYILSSSICKLCTGVQ